MRERGAASLAWGRVTDRLTQSRKERQRTRTVPRHVLHAEARALSVCAVRLLMVIYNAKAIGGSAAGSVRVIGCTELVSGSSSL